MLQRCKDFVGRLTSKDEEDYLLQRAFFLFFIGAWGITMFRVLYIRWRWNTESWFEARNVDHDTSIIEQWCNTHHVGQEILCTRLAEQAKLAHVRATFHFDLFSHYASEHFSAVSVAFWAAVFVAACLAYIAKKGWDNTHNVITTCFLAFSIHLAFFQGFPMLAQHSKNIAENESLYLDHMNLRQEIRTYCASGSGDDGVDLVTFVRRVDTRLKEMNRIPLEFDASQVNAGAAGLLELHQE